MSCVATSPYAMAGINKGDSELKSAMAYLLVRLRTELKKDKNLKKDWFLQYSDSISLFECYSYLKMRDEQEEGDYDEDDFDSFYENRVERPDGGIIWLVNKKSPFIKFPIIISEVKTQGTNAGRAENGLEDQNVGNAIERLGKYGISFRTLYEYEDILPFVTFCYGCDFKFDSKNKPVSKGAGVVGAKLVEMNGGFSRFNKVYTSKNMPKRRRMLPNTIMAQEKKYSVADMLIVLEEVGFDSLNYFKNLINGIYNT